MKNDIIKSSLYVVEGDSMDLEAQKYIDSHFGGWIWKIPLAGREVLSEMTMDQFCNLGSNG